VDLWSNPAWYHCLLAVPCYTCKAKPGERCNSKTKRTWHLVRQDRAMRLYRHG